MQEPRKRLRRTNIGRRAARLFCCGAGDVLPARCPFSPFAVRNTGNRKGRDKGHNGMNAELGGFLNHEVHSTSFERSLSQCEVKGVGYGRDVFRNADLGMGRRDTEDLTVIGYSSFIAQGDSCATPEP